MINYSKIKVPDELKGAVISINGDDIRIPSIEGTVMVEIYNLPDITDKKYRGIGLGFYTKEENSEEKTYLGADRIDGMNI